MTRQFRVPRPRPKRLYHILSPDHRPHEWAPVFPSYQRDDWNYKKTRQQWPDVRGWFLARGMEWSDELLPHTVWKLKWSYRIARLLFLHEKQEYIEPQSTRYTLAR